MSEIFIKFVNAFRWATPHMLQDPALLKYLEDTKMKLEKKENGQPDVIQSLGRATRTRDEKNLQFYSITSLRGLLSQFEGSTTEGQPYHIRVAGMSRHQLEDEVIELFWMDSLLMGMPTYRAFKGMDPVDVTNLAIAFGVPINQSIDQLVEQLVTMSLNLQLQGIQAALGWT